MAQGELCGNWLGGSFVYREMQHITNLQLSSLELTCLLVPVDHIVRCIVNGKFICVSFYLSTITIEGSQQVTLPKIKSRDNRKVAKRDSLVMTLLGQVYITLLLPCGEERRDNPTREVRGIIARNLKKCGWSLGYVSAIDSKGRTIWIADAHRGGGQRFIVHAEKKLTASSVIIHVPSIDYDPPPTTCFFTNRPKCYELKNALLAAMTKLGMRSPV